MDKKIKRGPVPMLEENKRKTISITMKRELWEQAEKRAKEKGFFYRGRVSVSAYLESLIEGDAEKMLYIKKETTGEVIEYGKGMAEFMKEELKNANIEIKENAVHSFAIVSKEFFDKNWYAIFMDKGIYDHCKPIKNKNQLANIHEEFRELFK